MQEEVWVSSPEPAVGGFHASRNLSRALSASLRDRLRQPWTEPVCRQVRQSGSGEGPGRAGRCHGAGDTSEMGNKTSG
jgi:hypothetical protein